MSNSFSQEVQETITPNDICQWMRVKVIFKPDDKVSSVLRTAPHGLSLASCREEGQFEKVKEVKDFVNEIK